MNNDDFRIDGELHDMEVSCLQRRIRELEERCGGDLLYKLKAAVVEDGVPKIIFNNDQVGDVEILVVDGVLTFRRAA